jgi:hypothetical protein
LPLITYDTVLWETPARRATSLLVNLATLLAGPLLIRIVDAHQLAILNDGELPVKHLCIRLALGEATQ